MNAAGREAEVDQETEVEGRVVQHDGPVCQRLEERPRAAAAMRKQSRTNVPRSVASWISAHPIGAQVQPGRLHVQADQRVPQRPSH